MVAQLYLLPVGLTDMHISSFLPGLWKHIIFSSTFIFSSQIVAKLRCLCCILIAPCSPLRMSKEYMQGTKCFFTVSVAVKSVIQEYQISKVGLHPWRTSAYENTYEMWLFGDKKSTWQYKRFSSSANSEKPPLAPISLGDVPRLNYCFRPLLPILIPQQSPLLLFLNYMTKSGLLISPWRVSEESSVASLNLPAPIVAL